VYFERVAAPGTRITAGSHRGRLLKTRPGLETRPTTALVREALFNIIGTSIEGTTVLDLFSGGGTLGIEALSRGAARAIFVDRQRACVTIVAENLAATGFAQRAEVHSADALDWLKAHRSDLKAFNLIVLDPPYRSTAAAETLRLLDTLSLRPEALVVAEHHRVAAMPDVHRLQSLRRDDYGATRLSFFRYPP
jgi:16S rRNA (guanine(966)-N(2))-methyltransferase RsmD